MNQHPDTRPHIDADLNLGYSFSRVLIVDDEPANIEVIRALLCDQSLLFEAATSGAEAMQKLPSFQPELILLDVQMPVQDGIETCIGIKQLPEFLDVPVLFVTVANDRLSDGFAAGGSDFITKPVTREELLCRIRVHLTNYKLVKLMKAQRNELAAQNERLREYRQMLEQERLIADRVMESMTSNNIELPGILRIHLAPQSLFSGDIVLTGIDPQGGLCILLGDFTGHGLAAAIGTVPVSTVFYQMLERDVSIGKMAREINRMLSCVIPDSMFCAAAILRLSPDGSSLEVWHGGLPEGYIVAPEGGISQRIEPMHMALAAEDDADFDTATASYPVGPGSRVYLFSDGITESFNNDEEMFGEDRLVDVLSSNAEDLFQELLNAVARWRGNVAQDDDVTLVELSCLPVPAPAARQGG